MRVYKLTDFAGYTLGNTKWGVGVTNEAQGSARQGLCTDGWIHWYFDPLLAVFLDPLHWGYLSKNQGAILWECEAREPFLNDHGLKGGSRSLTTLRVLQFPKITPRQKVIFALLCVKEMLARLDAESIYCGEGVPKYTEDRERIDYQLSTGILHWPSLAFLYFRMDWTTECCPESALHQAYSAGQHMEEHPGVSAKMAAEAVGISATLRALDLIPLAHAAMAWDEKSLSSKIYPRFNP